VKTWNSWPSMRAGIITSVSYRLIGRHQCKATSAGLGAWYRWIGGGPGQTLDHCRAAAFAGGGGCSTTFFYYFNDGNCACSRSTLNCALPTSWTGAIGPMLYGPSSSYNALPNGPGCSGSTAILNAHECGIAAATLGFSRSVHSGSWSHAPRGCHVGHPSDNWRNTYFNHLSGATGRAHYMSICYQRPSRPTQENPVEAQRSYSSVYSNEAPGYGHARSMLDSAQAWSPARPAVNEWMQIDLGVVKSVVGVVTQGRGHGQRVTGYTVSTSTDGSTWTPVNNAQQFSGNTDQGTKVPHRFSPIDARYVRFYVKTWNSWPSMRAGIITFD